MDNLTYDIIVKEEDVIETLKDMVFGEDAFIRFDEKERFALSYAIKHLEKENYSGNNTVTSNKAD